MKIKLFFLVFGSLFLSSCCWFAKYDCAELSSTFTVPVSINYADSVINVNEPLALTIESDAFQSIYEDGGFTNSSFAINITWFDGNFTSQANHRVNLLSSNINNFPLEEYSGYNGPLPPNIELELGFTVPGYYLIQFSGGASKEGETKRRQCGCGNYQYQGFQFESNLSNAQYFPLYNNSTVYSNSLANLNFEGAYFIKVE